ncbi:hypothetical protein F511_26838 [Dorcoceras hygrometricum]|uniref:Uncharacterized protein n=1 Tax=Dorcoceras hygrometricum TaxID=472368 RepID=A0A2Z7BU18_9LAMI|nr:hypothetical protein F511_26838 [Dorcoceras hygrometricum]
MSMQKLSAERCKKKLYAADLFMEVRSSISYVSPSSAIGKDPLEDFDCSDPRYNPLLRPAAARTPSNH